MQATTCGIDFGTSNSTLALADASGARLVALEGSHVTLPSAVFWDAEGAPPLFGRAAIAAYVEGEEGRLMRGLKSTLGSALIHEKTRVGNRAIAFTEVLGRFFGHLRSRLDAAGGEGIDRAVLGRPVHFVDGDAAGDAAAQDVLERLARKIGLNEVAFQYEPIAAALHYEQGISREELVLIVDIGGGTSDFSIVRVSPERSRAADRQADILANDGVRVGGTDFDRLLSLAEVMPLLGYNRPTRTGTLPRHYFLDLATWHRINALYAQGVTNDLKALRKIALEPERLDRMLRVVTTRAGHALAMAVEAAKITLTAAPEARVQIADLTGGPDPLATRAAFEAAIAPPLERVSAAIQATLAQAGLAPAAIGTVFLTGGSSSLPALRAAVAAILPGVPFASGDDFGSVGTGLALDARRRLR